MTTIIGGIRWRELLLGLILFKLVIPHLQPGVVRSYPVRGVLVPQPLVAGTNRSYLDL
jgi:hypothetical protein